VPTSVLVERLSVSVLEAGRVVESGTIWAASTVQPSLLSMPELQEATVEAVRDRLLFLGDEPERWPEMARTRSSR
jgi:hypothetical protein